MAMSTIGCEASEDEIFFYLTQELLLQKVKS